MTRVLTETIKTVVDHDLKEWVQGHAAKMERSEGSIVRLALHDYRAKMTRRKDG